MIPKIKIVKRTKLFFSFDIMYSKLIVWRFKTSHHLDNSIISNFISFSITGTKQVYRSVIPHVHVLVTCHIETNYFFDFAFFFDSAACKAASSFAAIASNFFFNDSSSESAFDILLNCIIPKLDSMKCLYVF